MLCEGFEFWVVEIVTGYELVELIFNRQRCWAHCEREQSDDDICLKKFRQEGKVINPNQFMKYKLRNRLMHLF